jgi:DNA-binding NarL/FixJ family response regulator
VSSRPAGGSREISAALFISVRAASVHVSGMVGKLSVASRGEAAAACELGLN